MKSMLGLVRPDEGQVRVLGMDAAHQAREIRRRLGYMPEHICLPLGMTARDLVVHMGELRGLPRRVAVLRASEVLFQVGLEEERSRLIRTFSIGMRQRTNLAQAIVHSPSLVILDEPTNGLDPAGREEMLDARAPAVRRPRDRRDHVVARARGRRPHLRRGGGAARRQGGRVAHPAPTPSGASERRGAGVQSRATRPRSPRRSRPPAWPYGRATTSSSSRAPTPTRCSAACATPPPTTGAGLRELRPAGPTLEDALIGA